jgi:hypothetical protein
MPLDCILAQCLEEAEGDDDAGDDVLRRYPEQARNVRPLLELAHAARRIYADVPEPPGGLSVGWARLAEMRGG